MGRNERKEDKSRRRSENKLIMQHKIPKTFMKLRKLVEALT